MIRYVAAAALGTAFLPSAAFAADTAPCAAGMVCASNPATVKAALERAGVKVTPGTDGQGDPSLSANNGYDYDVFFYGCENHTACDSLRFEIMFKKDPSNTASLANTWNGSKRFVQMSVLSDGRLRAAMDVATIGGMNQANFADVVDWWNSMASEMDAFFKQQGATG